MSLEENLHRTIARVPSNFFLFGKNGAFLGSFFQIGSEKCIRTCLRVYRIKLMDGFLCAIICASEPEGDPSGRAVRLKSMLGERTIDFWPIPGL